MWLDRKLGKPWSMLRGSANRTIVWVRQSTKTARLMLGSLGRMQWVFLAIAIAAGLFGFHLQQKAFPQSAQSPFTQISATVYTRLNPSRVLLKAWIAPNASQQDRLSITVKGPQGKSDPWLLVVTCPHRTRVKMQLIGAGAAPSSQSPYVLASVHNKSHDVLPLGCLSRSSIRDGPARPVVVTGQDINLSLPVLEQTTLGQSATGSTPLYVMRGPLTAQAYKPNLPIRPDLPIKELVQVFQAPGSTCPEAGAKADPPAAATSRPGKSNGQRRPSPSPSAEALAGPPGNACYTSLPAIGSPTAGISTKYNIPTSVTTSETLENVSLSGDRIDSMFPPGQINSDQIIWQGLSGLSPDLSATSLTNDENASRDGFFAGLFYGLAAGLFVPFLQGLSDAHEKVQGNRGGAQDEAVQAPDG